MKKKIIFGLAIFALMFFFGGIYIFKTTETIIYDMHRISQMHRIMVLRKDLLLSIKKNQEKIILRSKYLVHENSPGAPGMVEIIERCVRCHPAASPTGEKMAALKNDILAYRALTQGVFDADPLSPLSGKWANFL